MIYKKQEINGAITVLKEACNQHERLLMEIRNEYEYHYESMKLPESDEKFLQHYGAYYALDNLNTRAGQPLLCLPPEVQERLNKLLACDKTTDK